MKNKYLLFALLTCLSPFGKLVLQAQVAAGEDAFEFLDLAPSPQITALGGINISTLDDNPALGLFNPSLLNEKMHQRLTFNYNRILGETGSGYFGYAHHWNDYTFHGSAQFMNYGDFQQRDALNQSQGEFSANESAFTIGASRQLYERMAIGANVKYISSSLAEYSASGLGMDIAATFMATSSNLTIGLTARNIGSTLDDYTETQNLSMPFSLDIGLSKRLKHLPFRFSVTYTNLDRWELRYDDPNQVEESSIFGDLNNEDSGSPWLDNFGRHFVLGGEFLIGKQENLRFRFGYNHRLRREMTVSNYRSLAGFSFGAGLKINRFKLDIGRQVSHLAGGFTHFSISTGIQEFKKQRTTETIPINN